MSRKTSNPTLLAASLFGSAVAGAAFLGSKFNPAGGPTRRWYRRLDKPAFTPPDRLFPIAWSVPYTMMAISAWRVWRERGDDRNKALVLWWVQLALNASWSPIFFGAKRPALALADLAALAGAVGAYSRYAFRADRASGFLMLPYLGWVLYAGAINEEVARLNR